MSQFKGTHGPWFGLVDGHYNNSKNNWSIDDDSARCSEVAPVTLADGTVVAFAVASDSRTFWDDRTLANANLIAAAPEMFQLLEWLIDIEGPQPGHVEWARKVRAVMDKALGNG